MATPLAITASTITVLNGTFSLAQNICRLKDVDNDLSICLSLLSTIHRDLYQARSLLIYYFGPDTSQHPKTPSVEYLHGAMERMEQSARTIGDLVEAIRVENETRGGIGICKRVRWVLGGKEKFVSRQWEVVLVHNGLQGAITRLSTSMGGEVNLPSYGEAVKVVRSPSERRSMSGKSTVILVDQLDCEVDGDIGNRDFEEPIAREVKTKEMSGDDDQSINAKYLVRLGMARGV